MYNYFSGLPSAIPCKNVTINKINTVHLSTCNWHFAVMACHLVDKYRQAIWGLFKDRFPADNSTAPFKCDVRHTEVVNMPAVAIPKTETTERLSATLLSMIPVSLSSQTNPRPITLHGSTSPAGWWRVRVTRYWFTQQLPGLVQC